MNILLIRLIGLNGHLSTENKFKSVRETYTNINSHFVSIVSSFPTNGKLRAANVLKLTIRKDVIDFVMNNFLLHFLLDRRKDTRAASITEGASINTKYFKPERIPCAYNPGDLSKDMNDLHFGVDLLPNQRSLGLFWNLEIDTFFFEVITGEKP